MPVNNDAISSMSGYNYQGKMMLLCALQRLKELLDKGIEITDFWAEIEAKEDFVLGRGSENAEINQEFYQVKAMLSAKNIEAYAKDTTKYGKINKSPLYKLLDARNAMDASQKSKCILVSAIEIKNWEKRKDYSSEFQEVELYRYAKTGRIVDVQEVPGYIKDVIRDIIRGNYSTVTLTNAPGQEEFIYGNLCQMLDRKVAKIHEKHSKIQKKDYKRTDYRIGFQDIMDEINCTGNQIRDQHEYYFKERCYESIAHAWTNGLRNCCSNCDMFDEEHKECNNDCAAKEALDLYLSSGNPEKVWKMLCPDKDEWTNDLSILQNLGADLLSEKFFQPLSYVKNSEKVALVKALFRLDVESALKAALLQDGISAELLKDNTVIPTLMNLSDRKKEPICKKLDSLYKNHEAKFAFAGHVITAKEENGDLLTKQWSHEQINEAWQQRIRDSDEVEKDKMEKKNSFKCGKFSILSIETLTQKLQEECKKNA